MKMLRESRCNMLSALAFYEDERSSQSTATGDGATILREAAARMDCWTFADFMDFAERYADYVCLFEKRSDYGNAGQGR